MVRIFAVGQPWTTTKQQKTQLSIFFSNSLEIGIPIQSVNYNLHLRVLSQSCLPEDTQVVADNFRDGWIHIFKPFPGDFLSLETLEKLHKTQRPTNTHQGLYKIEF